MASGEKQSASEASRSRYAQQCLFHSVAFGIIGDPNIIVMMKGHVCLLLLSSLWLVRSFGKGRIYEGNRNNTVIGHEGEEEGAFEVVWAKWEFSEGPRLDRLPASLLSSLQASLMTHKIFSEVSQGGLTECWRSQPWDEEGASSTIFECDVRSSSRPVRMKVLNRRRLSGTCPDGEFDSNGVCTACVTGCKVCSDATSCLTCSDGYFLSTGNTCLLCHSTCSKCAGAATNCLACSGCLHPFDLTEQPFQCTTVCQLGCISCADAATCEMCEGAYVLKGVECVTPCNSMCETCLSPTVCIQCKPSFHFTAPNSGVCSDQCPTGCSECSWNTVCNVCQAGFFLKNGLCEVCHSSCATCVGSWTQCVVCSTCLHPFNSLEVPGACTAKKPDFCATALDSLRCAKCKPGYHFQNADSYLCSDLCPNNCASCSFDAICDVCQDGYFLNANAQCSICHKSCKTCTGSAANCISCSDCLHPLDMSLMPGYCSAKCQSKCLSCSDDTTCTQCKVGYEVIGNFGCAIPCHAKCAVCPSPPICSQCMTGYHFSEPGSLVCSDLCPDNCAACSADAVCDLCKDGYFLTPGKLCGVCHESCKTCVGSSTSCLVCNNCLHPFSKASIPGECSAKCPPFCTTCDDQLTCTQCNEWYGISSMGGCVLQCHVMCAVCPSPPVCISCNSGYHLVRAGSLVCSDHCPSNCKQCSSDDTCDVCEDGYFVNDAKLCAPCHETCTTCFGDADACLVCALCLHPFDSTVIPGACSARCPEFCVDCIDDITCTKCAGGYESDGDGGCQKAKTCSIMCESCPSPPICLKCPDGYFVDSYKSCSPCHSTCKTCVGEDTSCIQCSGCLHPFDSSVVPGTCSARCPMMCKACSDESTCMECYPGYQSDGSGGCMLSQCVIPNCSLCGPNTCIECKNGYGYDAKSVTCLQTCNPGYKCSSCLGGECKTCQAPYTQISGSINCQLTSCGDSNCLDCSSTQCSLCQPGWNLVPGSKTCLRVCDQNCEYCSTTQCLTCIDSTYEPVANTQSCRLKCPSHTYRNAQQTCSECDLNCAECTLKSISCTSCPQGLFPLFMLPGKCTANCSSSCSICVSPAIKCVVCSTGYFPTKDIPGTCTSICESSCDSCYPNSATCMVCAFNYLPQTILPGVCVSSCNTACATCSGAANKCTTCKRGYQPATTLPGPCMDKTKCHPSCRDKTSCPNAYQFCTACSQGYSLNGDYCMRETCHSSCITCNGPDYTDCLSCPPTANFVSSIGICLYTSCAGLCQSCYGPEASQCSTCMQNSSKTPGSDFCSCNMYFKLQTNVCIYNGPCHESCTSCSNAGPGDCLSCPGSAELLNGQCNCILGFEWVSAQRVCVYKASCQPQCKGCNGPRIFDCTSCPDFATLSNGTCSCLPSYVWAVGKTQCAYTGVCDSTCVTCKGPLASQCLTCVDIVNGGLVGNTCICSNGYAWNPAAKKCAYAGICVEAFSVCSGPNDSQGLICDVNSHKVGTGCKCSSPFSWDPTVNACTQGACNPVCETCRGFASSDCISCRTSSHHVIRQGTCVCAEGYFGVVESKTIPCTACHLTCKHCSSPEQQHCTDCYDNASLNPVTSACDCRSGYYLNPDIGLCYPCHDICGSCSGPLTTNCLSCRTLFKMDGTTCICQTGYFYLSKTNTCEPCHASCLTCSGPAQTQCLSCTSVQVLTSGTCNCIDTTKYNDGGKCSDCYVGCLTCAGPGSDMCLSCYPSALLFLVPGPSSCACVGQLRPAPTPNVCKDCPVTCSNCDIVDPNRCTACKTNSVSVSGSFPSACVCRVSYYFDSGTESCTMCDQSCASCSDSSPFSCLACKKYANEGGLFCEEYCPAGLSPRDGVCVAGTNPLIFSLSFSHLSTNKDIESSYAAVLASTSATVPVVIYQQGVRLQSDQFVRLPPNTNDPRSIVFAASHYVEMWVKPSLLSASQVIMNKRIAGATLVSLEFVNSALAVKVFMYSLTVPAGTNVTPLYTSSIATTVQVSGGEFLSNSAWIRVGYSVQLTGRNSLITIFANGVSLGTSMQTGMLFRDFSGAEWMLGTNSGNSFQGQIAEVRVFLGTKPEITPIGCLCPVCTSSGMCLSSCSIYEYYSTTCAPCLSTCRDGCIRGSDCRNNKDPLCSVFTDFYECLQCGNLSMMKSGTCVCVEDSVFSESAASCRCKEGTQPSGNQCVTCQSYFRPNEVTAEMDTSFLTATLTFARAVIPSISACSDIFDSATLDKFGLSPTCAFDSTRKVLTVYFGTGATVLGEPLVLLNKKLASSEGACSAISNALAPMLRLPEAPVPVVMLATAGQYSIPCGSDEGLTMSAAGSSGGAGRPLSYRWIFKAVPAIMSVSDYMTYNPNQSSITISRSVMKTTTLTVTVYVKNAFGKEASLTRSVQILGNAALSIAIEGGTKAFITSNQKYMFKAKLKVSCGTVLPSLIYKWEQTAGPTASGITSATSSLEIKKNSLQGGEVYSFKCSVIDAQNGAAGDESLELTVAKGPLIAQCTRGDGEQSFSKDIVINCNGSKDTDAPTSTDMMSLWTCKKNNDSCKSTQGKVLLERYAGLVLFISAGDLAVGTGYEFTLTLSKDVREDQVSIRIDIVQTTDCEITVEVPNTRFSASEGMNLQPSVKAPTGSTFLWIKTSGPPLTLSTPATSSFLGLAAGSASEGQVYTFNLIVSPPSGTPMKASITLKMNAPPKGGQFTVTPLTGIALDTIFSLSQAGWEDPEMSDYPITAQFGYAKSDKNVFFSVPTVATDYKTSLFPGNLVLVTRICDSLDSCSSASTPITVAKVRRALASRSLTETFDRMTVDEDLVPTACVVFANSVDMQGDVWTHVLGRLMQYASSFSEASQSQLEAALTCLQALSQSQPPDQMPKLLSAAKMLHSDINPISRRAFQGLVGVLQDFTLGNLAQAFVVRNYTEQLQQLYLRSLLPEEEAVQPTGSSLSLLNLKTFPAQLSGKNFTLQNAAISLPFSFNFETFFLPTAVVDLRAGLTRVAGFPSAILDISVYVVGTYSEFAYSAVSQQKVEMRHLTNKMRLVLPMYEYQEGVDYACFYYVNKSWDSSGCQIVSISNSSATLEVSHLSTFLIYFKDFVELTAWPLPVFPVHEIACDKWYAPIIIIIILVIVPLFFLGVIILQVITKQHIANRALYEAEQRKQQLTPHVGPYFAVQTHSHSSSTLHLSIPDERSYRLATTYFPHVSHDSDLSRSDSSGISQLSVAQERSNLNCADSSGISQISVPQERSLDNIPEINPPDSSLAPAELPSSQGEPAGTVDTQREGNVQLDHPEAKAGDSIILEFPSEPQLHADFEEEDFVQVSNLAYQPLAVLESVHRATAVPEKIEEVAPVEEEERPVDEIVAFLDGHYLVGLVWEEYWLRWEKLLCLLTVFLCHLCLLGIFYYTEEDSRDEGEKEDDSYYWSEYIGNDALYYLYTVLLTFTFSAVLSALFSRAESREGLIRVVWLVASIAVCFLASVAFIVLTIVINVQLCYEYVGRWCIGFFFCVLTEVFVLEFAIAAVKFKIVWKPVMPLESFQCKSSEQEAEEYSGRAVIEEEEKRGEIEGEKEGKEEQKDKEEEKEGEKNEEKKEESSRGKQSSKGQDNVSESEPEVERDGHEDISNPVD